MIAKKIILEMKSSLQVTEKQCKNLMMFKNDFKNADFYVISRDPNRKIIDQIHCLHWIDALNEFF